MKNWSVRAALLLSLSLSPAALADEVKPHPCRVPWSEEEVLCATYPVWENRETRQGRKIDLNVVILPATEPALESDKQPDPVFEIAGGPGQAATEVGEWAGVDRRKRDVVLVDQRGTGKSNPLHCDLYGNPVDFRRAAGELYPADAVRECREKLEKVADLSQYTTAAFVDDLNEVRQWLGYGKINVIGGSYGSRAAQVYPATPPEMAEKASRHMTNRLHVVIPRGAHGGGGECRVKLVNDFLDRGSVQGLEPACAVSESQPTRFTVPAPTTGPVPAVERKPYPCRVRGYDRDILCATYPVWENRETRQGRKIGLNIVILPATGPHREPDPVFEFGGGPGQGIAGDAAGFAGSPISEKRDIVLVDQRGAGRSNPLHCDFYGEPLDLRLAVGDMFPIDAVKRCREKLEKVADLTQYTTAAFADDLNEVRQWLGYDKINLEGGSYGTRSAMMYWRRHPETVRSAVLTGTTGLDVHLPIEHAAAGQRALDLLLAECASQPECRAAFPDTRADLAKVRERIEQDVTVTVTNPKTKERQEVRPTWGLVAEGMRFLMYGRAAAGLPLQIRQAAEGNLEPLIQMAIERRLDITDGLDWGQNFSISCAEDLPFITEEKIREKTAGTYLGDYRIRQQKAVCEVWPRARIALDTHEPVRSDSPVLLISGERDPVTPPHLAERASRFMTNHLHVIVPRGSHGVGGECMVRILLDFLDRASVQGLDTSCLQILYGPTEFTLPAPDGPVEAVEKKPYPCRVPGLDEDVLCATYPVWENRETKQGRKIGLNIVILPATGPDKQLDPVFELAGGPGQAAASIAGFYPGSSPLREKRDIVFVDQRGTGKSNPLDCELYGNPFDLRLAAGDMFPAGVVAACRERLEKVADLGQYTSAAFADDLNEVREWLGYDKINLSGGSYGTRVAQLYWRRHPESVRSVVLSGTASPEAHIPLDHAAAGQRALDILAAECASQPECRAAYPDVHADLKAIRERIEKGVTVTVTNPVTKEKGEVRPTWGLVAEGVRFLMYGPAAAGLPLQLRQGARGDLGPLVQMAVDRRLAFDRGLYWGLGLSVTCAEDLPFISEEMSRGRTAGTYLGDYRIRQQKAACADWPRGRIPADFHEPVRSDLPVLLISGERDPVVPPELTERAARFMTNRLHVVVPRGSHGAAGECTDNLIRDFVDRASVEGLDPSCAASVYGPTQFTMP